MKTLLTCFFCLFFTCCAAFAQIPPPAKEKFQSLRHSGIKAGINLASISNMAESDNYFGFHAGVMGNVQVSEGFGYGGEIGYSQQGALVQNLEFALNYLSIPLLLNLHAYPVTFQAGVYGSYLFSANVKDGQVRENISSYFQETDYGLLAGLNFNTSGPVLFSARFNLGLNDINNGFALPKSTVVKNRNLQFGAGYKF